ncbi:MAG TPA: DUF4236 domain-containing protein [Chitinophaga sp.]|uniref:DUF4236 domain-containing protein n=1 Tax=Chitinophaga sp. TaxID=1869181 RepID=UPI002BE9EF3E|nr:DUF4236 domain-containing protein [Chitinophaga sp.]HVI46210.1 DUF4236 domain-containing protein [Chitinophaga sp.]
MSWSYRKSIGIAPFRINISKQGIGYSIGVKGARVNVSPKGTYVNLNFHGISYRRKISGPSYPSPYIIPQTLPAGSVNNIASADVEQLTDTDSQAFITELNRKCAQASYVKKWGILPFCTIMLILLSVSFDQQQNLANEYLGYELIACVACFVPLICWLRKLDKRRFKIELHYEMDDRYQQVYKQLKTHFDTFSQSSRIWQYLDAQHTTDHKRNAGAVKLIRRVNITSGMSANKIPMPYFITNVAIPCISLSNMELFFLPERLLIKREGTFAAVFYKNLRITGNAVRFVEWESLPRDARVVDYTWQYVNKNGGPDRRFNDNRKLPVCTYSEYRFTSDTGISEIIATSKLSAMDDLGDFLAKIGGLQKKFEGGYN